MPLTIDELIERLEMARMEDSDLDIAAAFEDKDTEDDSIHVASVDLQNVLLCIDSGYLVLQFAPIPAVKESLEIAEVIQDIIDEGEAEVLEEEKPEDPDEEGLSP